MEELENKKSDLEKIFKKRALMYAKTEHDLHDKIYSKEQSKEIKVLLFDLGDESFAIDTKSVSEIIKVTSYTKLLDAQHPLLGVINHRGQSIALYDFPSSDLVKIEKIYAIIIKVHARSSIALMIGEPQGIIKVKESDIQETSGKDQKLMAGIISGKRSLIQIDALIKELGI